MTVNYRASMIGLQSHQGHFRGPMQRIFTVLLGIAILVLSISYSIEYFFHLDACKLCKIQRLPYFILAAGSLLGLYIQHKKILLKILQACLLLGFFIACYHSAVVFGILEDHCLANPKISDMASFKMAIESAVPCSTSAWKFFNIPASVFNACLSASLAIAIQIVMWKKTDDRAFIA
jgi:disulfide bond formation protein DsbB